MRWDVVEDDKPVRVGQTRWHNSIRDEPVRVGQTRWHNSILDEPSFLAILLHGILNNTVKCIAGLLILDFFIFLLVVVPIAIGQHIMIPYFGSCSLVLAALHSSPPSAFDIWVAGLEGILVLAVACLIGVVCHRLGEWGFFVWSFRKGRADKCDGMW